MIKKLDLTIEFFVVFSYENLDFLQIKIKIKIHVKSDQILFLAFEHSVEKLKKGFWK